ncbi:hypothetical protein acdb102_01290 [Acidothermaceae bacterium B102]|nr:hypothetical protein acdb102_01290 [Acidothermaceae bacterium B102]
MQPTRCAGPYIPPKAGGRLSGGSPGRRLAAAALVPGWGGGGAKVRGESDVSRVTDQEW